MESIRIREAQQCDFDFVVDLMDKALTPYYDGDHRAHAARIFNTHISGGEDLVGHFSREQRMFILVEGESHLGMINIVGKKQGTWKISPLIVAPRAQGSRGFGTKLLTYAEQYARNHEARQMYCTVAFQNNSAFQFFRRRGYSVAGKSVSHYKPGVTEVMLYKNFPSKAQSLLLTRDEISIIPFEEKYSEQARQLILDTLPPYFSGVDDDWVDALYRGYQRRNSREVNTKYKLIFVAVNRQDQVLGVMTATPKKGEPIKLMPCVASTPQAFAAMLIDTPQLLREFGRKIYIHCLPSVDETMALQRLGWTLDAIMPAAYHNDHCTQQWGNTFEDGFMRNMRVKALYYDHIMAGRKPLEVRVGYANIKKIKPGERVNLMTSRQAGVIRIDKVRTYDSFKEMLKTETAEHIAPGKTTEEVLALLRRIYPRNKENLGVIVLQISPDTESSS